MTNQEWQEILGFFLIIGLFTLPCLIVGITMSGAWDKGDKPSPPEDVADSPSEEHRP